MRTRVHMRRIIIGATLVAAARMVPHAAAGGLPESDLAAPGAPLYEAAVAESVRTLLSKKEQAVAGRPPSPGPDYYWCEQCKAYHQRQAGTNPSAPPAQASPGAAVRSPAAGAVPAAGPPSAADGRYWCEQCKSYHIRTNSPPRTASAPVAVPAQAAASTPTPVSPSASGDRYYCENCKTYHSRTNTAHRPVTLPSAPAGSAAAGQTPGGDYYYCDNCKTYHRRQATAHQPLLDLNGVFDGTTNRRLLVPTETKP